MPSVVQGPCPAAPFRMPGSGLPQVHGLAAVTPLLVISFAYARLLRATNARPPSACPVAVGARFSRTKVTLADFCNLVTTHEHTLRAFRSSHASGALAPLHAGINGCRLRWYPPCVAARGTCEPQSARQGLRSQRSTCVDESDRGPKHPSKGKSRDRGRFACALLMVHRAPGSPNRVVVRSG